MTDTEPTLPIWEHAEQIVAGEDTNFPIDVGGLAREVLRLRDYGLQVHELLDSDRGYDLLLDVDRRLRNLYRGINQEVRWYEARACMTAFGLDGSRVTLKDLDSEWEDKWNRLISLGVTCAAVAVANGRWAVLEHRRAEHLVEMVKQARLILNYELTQRPPEHYNPGALQALAILDGPLSPHRAGRDDDGNVTDRCDVCDRPWPCPDRPSAPIIRPTWVPTGGDHS